MVNENDPIHPGPWVRESILSPRGISVTDAAKLVGISRPGVSNFLNAKVSATPDMAARLERAFGVPAQDIIEKQAAFDAHIGKAKGGAANARAFVMPFLNIKANDLIGWFSTSIAARTQLSVLLRTLVHSSGHDLLKVDFPGNDDAERPGWDGFVEANAGTPWIPQGRSGWEFGVNVGIKGKADGDFAKSVKATPASERQDITFVFVTPRRWSSKDAWVKAMKAKGFWKDVKAYDASDLEQWMAQSIPAQTWFANQTARPSSGVRALVKCWTDWASVAHPALHPSLFSTPVKVWHDRMKSFLAQKTFDPLVITADSVEEAVAFLSQILSEPEFIQHKDRVLVFDETGALPKLAQGTTDFIAVAHTRDVEREFGPYSSSMPTIVIYPRNAVSADPHIVLEPLGYETFNEALEAMGKTRDEIAALTNESGRSLTVLRRRLATIPAIQAPEWASNHLAASNLISFALVGAWDVRNEADQAVLSLLAENVTFDALERRIQQLLQLNDSPVWSIGNFRGVVSKIDSLFAISGAVTQVDLDHFFQIAKNVLGEDDPVLDLPEGDRWAAAIHGKKRKFSSSLREGISETLVLLSVHGRNLFGKRLGFDGENAVSRLVSELLEPIDTRKLEANDNDLRLYAEAAPDAFLTIIERDLRSASPATFGLLRPAATGLFGSPARTGLLWALEGLAWNPATFPRVVRILARLSEVQIEDNWVNKPIGSLGAIFRAWMPQTAANHDMRLQAMRMLIDRHPAAGWEICLQQIGDHSNRVGHYSHKPKWRPDGYGFGEPFRTWGPISAFVREMVEIALTRPTYTVDMLCDLVAQLHALAPDDQDRVWKIIDAWRKAGASDDDIAIVREKIRVSVMSRRGRKKVDSETQATLSKSAKAIYDAMEPSDVVNRYEWLFRQHWVEESADELADFAEGDVDFRAREARIEKLRSDALSEVVANSGLAGVFRLAEKGNAQRQIGWHLARGILNAEQFAELIARCVASSTEDAGRNAIAAGALHALDGSAHRELFDGLRDKISDREALRILLLSPYRPETWALADQLPTEIKSAYWRDVVPQFIYDAQDQNNESVSRLMDHKRPRAAFAAVHFKLEDIRPEYLVRMLNDMLKAGDDKQGEYQLRDYDIQKAFQILDTNSDLSLEEKAGLEFAYLDALGRSSRGGDGHQIPNLERYVEEHPEMFVQAIVSMYRRKTPGEDPKEYQLGDDKEHVASRGYRLLEALKNIPGQGEAEEEKFRAKLMHWISVVRKMCSELDRAEVADVCIGQLLAHASEGKDKIWPNEAVRNVMEELQSEDVSRGAQTGLYNSRGVHWRGEGGDQEREIAVKYRKWGEALHFTHPFVSSSLLITMAKSYEHEAEQQDTEAGIRRRLRH